MSKRYILAVFAALSLKLAIAQPTFSAPDTIRYLDKTTAFGALHDNLPLKNNTADSLLLKWKLNVIGGDSAWTVNMDDPSQLHVPVFDGDSAFFVLPDSSQPFGNLMIIGVQHNGNIGYGLFIFTISDTATGDSLRIYFDVTVRPDPLGTSDYFYANVEVFPNPAQDFIWIKNTHWFDEKIRYKIFDINGKEHSAKFLHQKDKIGFDVSDLKKGTYFLQMEDNETAVTKFFTIH